MAWYDDYEDDRAHVDFQDLLFNESSPYYDDVAHDLFMEGVIHDNEDAYIDFVDYMDYMYDIDFEAEFDYADVEISPK